MSWPSGTKASTAHTDSPQDLISAARADINQNITNVNAVIDYFGPDGAYDIVGTWNKQQYANLQTLTAGATINWDLDNNQVSVLTLDQNSTLANPTNKEPGATYILIVKQPGGANYSLAFGTDYKFPNTGAAPTITAKNAAVDIFTFISDGTNMYGGFVQDFA
jgi:hypothetical protein